MMPEGFLIGGKIMSRDGRKKNKSRRILGSDSTDHQQGVRGVEVEWW